VRIVATFKIFSTGKVNYKTYIDAKNKAEAIKEFSLGNGYDCVETDNWDEEIDDIEEIKED